MRLKLSRYWGEHYYNIISNESGQAGFFDIKPDEAAVWVVVPLGGSDRAFAWIGKGRTPRLVEGMRGIASGEMASLAEKYGKGDVEVWDLWAYFRDAILPSLKRGDT